MAEPPPILTCRTSSRRTRRHGRPARRGRVGRHRHAPTVRARSAVVDDQVDRHRDRHAHQTRGEWQHESAPLAQVAEVELAPGLQPDDEEEQRHQPAVDPCLQVAGDSDAADPDGDVGTPDRVVGGGVEVTKANATTTAATSTTELDDSVCRNSRSGAGERRFHIDRSALDIAFDVASDSLIWTASARPLRGPRRPRPSRGRRRVHAPTSGTCGHAGRRTTNQLLSGR